MASISSSLPASSFSHFIPPISIKPTSVTRPCATKQLKNIFQPSPFKASAGIPIASAPCAIIPLLIIPVGASGERPAPLAEPTTIKVIKNAGIFNLWAIAIAKGAIKAGTAILPGPIAVNTVPIAKSIKGISAALPLHKRKAWSVTFCSVPLVCAIPKKKVTPANSIKSVNGKNF